MKSDSLLIYCTHGTYGRDDDVFGALLVANTSLAKGMRTTLLLTEEGVMLLKKGQDPGKIGLPDNFRELGDFIDLGGRLCALDESLLERGLTKDEIMDEVEILSMEEVPALVEHHKISLTF